MPEISLNPLLWWYVIHVNREANEIANMLAKDATIFSLIKDKYRCIKIEYYNWIYKKKATNIWSVARQHSKSDNNILEEIDMV